MSKEKFSFKGDIIDEKYLRFQTKMFAAIAWFNEHMPNCAMFIASLCAGQSARRSVTKRHFDTLKDSGASLLAKVRSRITFVCLGGLRHILKLVLAYLILCIGARCLGGSFKFLGGTSGAEGQLADNYREYYEQSLSELNEVRRQLAECIELNDRAAAAVSGIREIEGADREAVGAVQSSISNVADNLRSISDSMRGIVVTAVPEPVVTEDANSD